MNQQFIYIIQAAGPVILMVALLVIAGAIGYLTAWLYAKSVYKPIIKRLEEEKATLQKQVSELNAEVAKKNETIDGLNKEVDGLMKDITNFKEKIVELEKEKKEEKN